MSDIQDRIGIQPAVQDELELRDKAMSGDLVLSISPTTVAPSPTSAAWTRNVVIELQTAAGEKHSWYSADLSVSIADTSTAGTASITDTTPAMVNGRCVVVVSGDAQDWLNTETDTLTVNNQTVLGKTVTGGTSVETFTT